jgi:hypothetical protein
VISPWSFSRKFARMSVLCRSGMDRVRVCIIRQSRVSSSRRKGKQSSSVNDGCLDACMHAWSCSVSAYRSLQHEHRNLNALDLVLLHKERVRIQTEDPSGLGSPTFRSAVELLHCVVLPIRSSISAFFTGSAGILKPGCEE